MNVLFPSRIQRENVVMIGVEMDLGKEKDSLLGRILERRNNETIKNRIRFDVFKKLLALLFGVSLKINPCGAKATEGPA